MTKIQWASESWNPIVAYDRETGDRGWVCTRVSPGCKHCYAARMNRLAHWYGTGHDYTVPNLDKVMIELASGGQSGVFAPLSWQKPRRVFVCSMTDIFGDWVTEPMLDRLFAVMAAAEQHTFQVLTKRPERMASYLRGLQERSEGRFTVPALLTHAACLLERDGNHEGANVLFREANEHAGEDWPPPNIWCGTSVEDQERADVRIPQLQAAPASVRFLSCEPLLGRLDLGGRGAGAFHIVQRHNGRWVHQKPVDSDKPEIDWVIVGGESGPFARRMFLGWAEEIVRQGRAAEAAIFIKQLGSNPVRRSCDGQWSSYQTADPKGGDLLEWPEYLRVREFPDEARVPA